MLKPPKSSGTRWIDHRRKALTSIDGNYKALIAHVKDVGSGERCDIKSENVAKVQGYLKILKTHKFVLYCAKYQDIVQPLAILSLSFQSDSKPINEVQIDMHADNY